MRTTTPPSVGRVVTIIDTCGASQNTGGKRHLFLSSFFVDGDKQESKPDRFLRYDKFPLLTQHSALGASDKAKVSRWLGRN